MNYEWQYQEQKSQHRNKKAVTFRPEVGHFVLDRFKNGRLKEVEFRVYTGVQDSEIYFLCNNNNWRYGSGNGFVFKELKHKRGFYSLVLSSRVIKHGEEYNLWLNGQNQPDPSSLYLSQDGKSVLWDFEDPSTYKFKYSKVDTFHRSTRILQTDLYGLVAQFFDENMKLYGHEVKQESIYDFIINSGVIKRIADLGFNTIQFLPFSQSIDGGKWSFRYLTPYVRAIDNQWGNPDSFRKMVDTFHKFDIAVISDLVISHAPYKDFNLCRISAGEIGIARWQNEDNPIYLNEKTDWGTMRYNFDDSSVRRFLADTALNYAHHYMIDGFRIDNVDGIIRKGKNGDGDEREHGRTLLREINNALYRYDPQILIHYESHFYKGNNAKWLVAPMASDPNALGATAYNSSRLTYFFHKDFMPKAADEISPWTIKHIIDEKEWGKSNSTVADFHNHDAAAGLIPMRATGSYAFDALTLGDSKLTQHAIGKIKVMEAIISFCGEGRILDLLQTYLLQTGTFEHDSSIYWDLEKDKMSASMVEYKKQVNVMMSSPAFYPRNVKHRKVINIDEKSKTLVCLRSDSKTNFLIFINMSSSPLEKFNIPTPTKRTHKLVFDSNVKSRFVNKDFLPIKVNNFEFFETAICLENVCGYSILIWEFPGDVNCT